MRHFRFVYLTSMILTSSSPPSGSMESVKSRENQLAAQQAVERRRQPPELVVDRRNHQPLARIQLVDAARLVAERDVEVLGPEVRTLGRRLTVAAFGPHHHAVALTGLEEIVSGIGLQFDDDAVAALDTASA